MTMSSVMELEDTEDSMLSYLMESPPNDNESTLLVCKKRQQTSLKSMVSMICKQEMAAFQKSIISEVKEVLQHHFSSPSPAPGGLSTASPILLENQPSATTVNTPTMLNVHSTKPPLAPIIAPSPMTALSLDTSYIHASVDTSNS